MDATSAHQDSLPVTSDALIARLDAMGISYDRFDHVPLMTVQDSKAVQGVMLGPEQGGLLVPDDGWFDALDRLVRDAGERQTLAAKARKWAATQTIDAEVERWEAVFGEAIELMSGTS